MTYVGDSRVIRTFKRSKNVPRSVGMPNAQKDPDTKSRHTEGGGYATDPSIITCDDAGKPLYK